MNTQTILVVEDMDMSREVASTMLKKLGYLVENAGNGIEAIEKFKAQPFAMVFMDVEMPLMDGHEATRIIRQELKLDSKILPIIALTAHSQTEDIARCYESGMDDILIKPFEFIELAAKVDEWLGGGSDSWHMAERENTPYKNAPLISKPELETFINFVGSGHVRKTYDGFASDMATQLLAVNTSSAQNDILRPTLHNLTASAGSLGMKKLSSYCQYLLNDGAGRERPATTSELHLLDSIFQESCRQFEKYIAA